MKYANLHLHSIYSDGDFTPTQLTLIGKSLGYYALALTDHETDGGVKDLFTAAKREGLKAISGAEFYGDGLGAKFHIVGLDYDMDNPQMRAFIRNLCERYTEYTRKCVERGLALGLIEGITWDDVMENCESGTWVCIDQVRTTLQRKRVLERCGGMAQVRATCFKGPEPDSFKPAHPSAEEVIKVIRQAGGVAILAHPNQQTQYVEQLVEMGLNGIEISHPHLFGNTASLALEAAKAFNLYRSGGTDHTGAMSGCGGVNAVPALNGITEEEYTVLTERRLG